MCSVLPGIEYSPGPRIPKWNISENVHENYGTREAEYHIGKDVIPWHYIPKMARKRRPRFISTQVYIPRYNYIYYCAPIRMILPLEKRLQRFACF